MKITSPSRASPYINREPFFFGEFNILNTYEELSLIRKLFIIFVTKLFLNHYIYCQAINIEQSTFNWSILTEAATRDVLYKKMFLKISQNLLEKTFQKVF